MTRVTGPYSRFGDAAPLTRRRFLIGAGAASLFALRGTAIADAQDTGTFTGPNLGLTVTWDPAIWQFAYGTTSESYDWITLVVATGPAGVPTSQQQNTLLKVRLIEAPFADIATADITDVYGTWVGDSSSSRVLASFATELGAAIVVANEFYETVEWFEVGPSPVTGWWRMTELILPIADITADYADLLVSCLTIDGGDPFLAASTSEVATTMVEAAAGDLESEETSAPPTNAAPSTATSTPPAAPVPLRQEPLRQDDEGS